MTQKKKATAKIADDELPPITKFAYERGGALLREARRRRTAHRDPVARELDEAMMSETTRVQLELPESHLRRLRRLKHATEAVSYAEVVRKAMMLYEKALGLQDSGETILIKDRSGNTRQLESIWTQSER